MNIYHNLFANYNERFSTAIPIHRINTIGTLKCIFTIYDWIKLIDTFTTKFHKSNVLKSWEVPLRLNNCIWMQKKKYF